MHIIKLLIIVDINIVYNATARGKNKVNEFEVQKLVKGTVVLSATLELRM